jgi:hypothetical protein
MNDGAATDMQSLYPEGYIFMHALYGLAWCDFARELTPTSLLHREALEEINKSCKAIRAPEARSIFDEHLTLPNGAFYTGWSNYLLGKKLSLEKPVQRNLEEVKYFQQQCELIASALNQYTSPYLESYYQSAWPADVVVCAASLRLHDKIFAPKYTATLYTWLGKVKNTLDPKGLIPHSVHPVTGQPHEGARGCSQSLMLIFMYEIDPAFGKQQFDIYKNNFPDQKLGLQGIREYPNDMAGSGDVDSGPVVFQIGAAASIVGMRTFATYHEPSNAYAIQCGIEAFGFTTQNETGKKYIFGMLPMADAFITWAYTTIPVDAHVTSAFSRSLFHIYSGLAITVIIVLLVVQWRNSLWKKQHKTY